MLEQVKNILGITGNEQDNKIQGYIDLFCNKIKSICNREDFPAELEYMAIDFAYKSYIYYKNKSMEDNDKLQVTSASDNGQSVNFKTIETVSKDDINLDKIVANNADEISMYAYMRW